MNECVCVCVCARLCVHLSICIRIGDQRAMGTASIMRVGPGAKTQIVRFGNKCLHPLSHLACPLLGTECDIADETTVLQSF